MVLKFIFEIAFFVFFFWFSRVYLVNLIKGQSLRKRFLFYVPIARNLFWIFYSFYFFSFLLGVNMLLSLVTLVFLVLIFWRVLKDLIFGVIYKIQKGNVNGLKITIDQVSGVVVAMKNTKIEVKDENDEVFQFSYSLLSSNKISIPNSNQTKILSLNYVLEKALSKKELVDLKKKLLCIPYIIAPNRMNVQVINSGDNYLLVVKVFLPNVRYVTSVKKNIDNLCSSFELNQ